MMAKEADFLAVFSKPQQDEPVMLLLRLHGYQNTAAETLWAAWLFPLAILVYRSRFLPKFLGIWLALDGLAYVVLSTVGILARTAKTSCSWHSNLRCLPRWRSCFGS